MSRISVPGVGSIPFTEEGILSAFSTQRDLVLRLRADLEGTNNELLRIRQESSQTNASQQQIITHLREENGRYMTELASLRTELRLLQDQVGFLKKDHEAREAELNSSLGQQIATLRETAEQAETRARDAEQRAADATEQATAQIADAARNMEEEKARIRRDMVTARRALQQEARTQIAQNAQKARAGAEAELSAEAAESLTQVTKWRGEVELAADTLYLMKGEIDRLRRQKEEMAVELQSALKACERSAARISEQTLKAEQAEKQAAAAEERARAAEAAVSSAEAQVNAAHSRVRQAKSEILHFAQMTAEFVQSGRLDPVVAEALREVLHVQNNASLRRQSEAEPPAPVEKPTPDVATAIAKSETRRAGARPITRQSPGEMALLARVGRIIASEQPDMPRGPYAGADREKPVNPDELVSSLFPSNQLSPSLSYVPRTQDNLQPRVSVEAARLGQQRVMEARLRAALAK